LFPSTPRRGNSAIPTPFSPPINIAAHLQEDLTFTMSLFRKCSFTVGDDTISIAKTGSNSINREFQLNTVQSARSSCSDIEINASDYAIHESCV
jgi:hypothetical protein